MKYSWLYVTQNPNHAVNSSFKRDDMMMHIFEKLKIWTGLSIGSWLFKTHGIFIFVHLHFGKLRLGFLHWLYKVIVSKIQLCTKWCDGAYLSVFRCIWDVGIFCPGLSYNNWSWSLDKTICSVYQRWLRAYSWYIVKQTLNWW